MEEGVIRIRKVQHKMEDASVVVEETRIEADYGGSSDSDDMSRFAASRWDKVGKLCVYAIAFLTPLFFLPYTVAPVDTAKIVMVGVLSLIAVVCYLLNTIERRVIAYPHSTLALAILGLVVASVIATIFSSVRGMSVFGNLVSGGSLLITILGGIMFFLGSYFLTGDDMPRLAKIVGSSIALGTLYALLQAFGHFIVPWAFTKQTGFTSFGPLFGWGIMMAMALTVATVLPSQQNRMMKILIGLFQIFMLFGLFILNYNLLWVGLAFLMIMIAAARFVSRESLGLPIVIGVIAIFLAFMHQRIPRVANLPIEVLPSFNTSFSVAKQTLFGGRILNGSGPSTFSYQYAEHRPVGLNQTALWSVRFGQGYDYILTTATETGLLGLLALAFLILVILRLLMPAMMYEHGFPLVAGILFIVISWFFFPATVTESMLFFIGLGALASITGQLRIVSLEALSPTRSFLGFMGAILLIVLSLSGFYALGQRYYASVQYGKAVAAYGAGDLNNAVAHTASAIQWDNTSDQYFRAASQVLLAQATQLAQSGAAATDVQVVVANAVQAAIRATDLNPRDSQNWSNAGSIYENLIPSIPGADAFAVESYKHAMDRVPNDPQEPVNAARALFVAANQLKKSNADEASSRREEAKKLLEHSLELKPDYAAARYLLAQIYLSEGNTDAAIARTEEIKAANPLDAGVAFQLGLLYYNSDQLTQARAELERAVALSQTYANARYFLGLIYDRKGMKQEALVQFREISALNPDNADVKQIITNLENGREALAGIVPPEIPPEERTEVPVPESENTDIKQP